MAAPHSPGRASPWLGFHGFPLGFPKFSGDLGVGISIYLGSDSPMTSRFFNLFSGHVYSLRFTQQPPNIFRIEPSKFFLVTAAPQQRHFGPDTRRDGTRAALRSGGCADESDEANIPSGSDGFKLARARGEWMV